MCGQRTRLRTDVDPPRFLDRTAIGGGDIVSPLAARVLVLTVVFLVVLLGNYDDTATARIVSRYGGFL